MIPKKSVPPVPGSPQVGSPRAATNALGANNNNSNDSSSKSIPPPPPPPDYPRRNANAPPVQKNNSNGTLRPLPPPPPPPSTTKSGPITRKPTPIPITRDRSAPVLPSAISNKVEKLEKRNVVECVTAKNTNNLNTNVSAHRANSSGSNVNNSNLASLARSISHGNFKEANNVNSNNNVFSHNNVNYHNFTMRPNLNKNNQQSSSSSNLPILHRNTNNLHVFSKNQTVESHTPPTTSPNFIKSATLRPARPDRNTVPVNNSNTIEAQPRGKIAPLTLPKTYPRHYSAPELSTEELVDKIYESLKKFCNSNKQIIVVSKSAELKVESSNHPSREVVKGQLSIGRDSLLTANTDYDAKVKTGMKSNHKSIDSVQEILQSILDVASSASFLISVMKSTTIEYGDESLFKQSLTSITTFRDSLSGLSDFLNSHPTLRNDPIAMLVKNIVKNSDMALNMILGSKAGKLITDCKRSELIAASKVAISSISNILNSLLTNNKSNLVTEVKVASCTISQLIATLNETISSNLNLFSLPSIKMKITSQSNNLKLLFGDFMGILIEIVSYKGKKASIDSLLEAFESIRNAVKEIVTDFCRYGEIDTSELAQGELPDLKPSNANINEASGAIKVSEDTFVAPPNEITYSFDLPADLVHDVDPIWKEPVEDEGRIVMSETDANSIKCATLNKLIINLTHPSSQDLNLTKTFITTYRSFTTPAILLKKVLQRYRVPKNSGISAMDTQTIRARTCNLLKLWIENEYQDFTEDLNPLLHEMFNELETNDLTSKISKNLRSFLEKCQRDNTDEIVNITIEQKIPLCPSALLFVFDEEELAKQLTIVDFQLFKAIRPVELINQAWSKPKLKHRAKHVTKFVARTTALSYWVASVILWQDTLKGRIRAFTKIINIAEYLLKLNNFNSLMAIIAGVNMTAIYRLKHTKNGLSAQVHESIQMFTEIMEASQSYANYRQRLRTSNPPCIPFLGTYLTDITFIEDGNPDYIKGLINFRKRELEYNVIREIQQFQQIGYSFNIVDNIAHYLTDLPILSEDELFALSNHYEPRNSSIEDIV